MLERGEERGRRGWKKKERKKKEVKIEERMKLIFVAAEKRGWVGNGGGWRIN